MLGIRIHVVSQQLDHDGAPIKGVFLTRKAAAAFAKFQKKIDPFDDYLIERWAVESLAEVRTKIKAHQNKKK